MAIEKQFQKGVAHVGELSTAVKDAAKHTFSKDGWKAAEGAEKVAADAIKDKPSFVLGALKILATPLIWAVNITKAIVKFPIDLAMRGGNAILGGATKAVTKYPKTAIVGGAIAATLGGAHMLAKHNAKKLEAQADAIQQLQSVQAVQGAAPVSYMNSASYADVQAKMDADRAAGAAPGTQTAALAARQAVNAPESASPAV